MKLHKTNVRFAARDVELSYPVEIRVLHSPTFTLFFRRGIFRSSIGWCAQGVHGDGYQDYYGWNLWDADDTQAIMARLRSHIENPRVVVDQLCPYCQNKLECLYSDKCVKCFPKWGL